jgi:hypothetical protein
MNESVLTHFNLMLGAFAVNCIHQLAGCVFFCYNIALPRPGILYMTATSFLNFLSLKFSFTVIVITLGEVKEV